MCVLPSDCFTSINPNEPIHVDREQEQGSHTTQEKDCQGVLFAKERS